jgi:LytS/YehU family sensor histidine kinase
MFLFGRGTYWNSYEVIDLVFVIMTFPLVFVLNSFLFIRKLAQNQRWLIYIICLTALLFLIETLRILLNNSGELIFFKEHNIFLPFSLAVIISWLYSTTKDWLINMKTIERLKAEKLSSELAFLKTQIDPHFLFNTLNNIYGLALEENSPKTADSIAKLGTLMRYNLHDSNAEMIKIGKEIDYIQNYIALQEIRLNENNTIVVDINVSENDKSEYSIAPMLLIPFIENAFKYGISPSEQTYINISINILNGSIELKTENSIKSISASEHKKGIGVANVKQRLNHLYNNKFSLVLEEAGKTYFVKLKIKLIQ